MSKKEAQKQVTAFTKQLRELADCNPNLFRNATLFFHGFDSTNLPIGFVLESTHASYRVYRRKEDGITVTAFCDEGYYR